jgi:hypothetical protein
MARALIPNSTQIPDVILDHWMAALSGAEFKVLLYVARRTYGFGKECDNISLNQMAAGIRRRDGTQLDHGTGLSRSGVKSACNSLIDRGILIRVNNRSEESRECEESTYRLNLYADPTGVGQKKAYVGHKKAQVGQKNAEGGPQTDRGVGQNLAPQETVQETDQETAAGEGKCEAANGAAALVEELVSHGVGRTAAVRFVGEKPETCRRCLEYLPYAKFRTSKGAWLANAIRDEYGPPQGYEDAKANKAKERDAASRALAQKALQKHGLAMREEKTARLRSAYQRLEETGGAALRAFNEYVEEERARTRRIAHHLSPARRVEVLAAFDRQETRLQLFEAWTNSGAGGSFPQAAPPTANALSPATGP